jgi:hypothetical protein
MLLAVVPWLLIFFIGAASFISTTYRRIVFEPSHAWPLAVRAQQSALPVIGFLNTARVLGPRPFALISFKFQVLKAGLGGEYRGSSRPPKPSHNCGGPATGGS